MTDIPDIVERLHDAGVVLEDGDSNPVVWAGARGQHTHASEIIHESADHIEAQRKINVDLFNECLRLKAENEQLRAASLGKISEIKQALEYCRAAGID